MIRLSELVGRFFPEFRKNQIEVLENSWKQELNSISFPSNISMHGGPATGKTHSVKYHFNEIKSRYPTQYEFLHVRCGNISIYEIWAEILRGLSLGDIQMEKKIPVTYSASVERYAQLFSEFWNNIAQNDKVTKWTIFLDELDTTYIIHPELIDYIDMLLYSLTDYDILTNSGENTNVGLQVITTANLDIFSKFRDATQSRVSGFERNPYSEYKIKEMEAILEKKIECSGMSEFVNKKLVTNSLISAIDNNHLTLRWGVDSLIKIAREPDHVDKILKKVVREALPYILENFYGEYSETLEFQIVKVLFAESDENGVANYTIRKLHGLWEKKISYWRKYTSNELITHCSVKKFWQAVRQLQRLNIIEVDTSNKTISLTEPKESIGTMIDIYMREIGNGEKITDEY